MTTALATTLTITVPTILALGLSVRVLRRRLKRTEKTVAVLYVDCRTLRAERDAAKKHSNVIELRPLRKRERAGGAL